MAAEDNEKNHKTDIDDLVDKVSPRLLILVAGGALMVALFAMISMLMMVSITSDMGELQDQIRKAGKTAKAMQEEMAELRTLLAPVTAAKRAEAAQQQITTQAPGAAPTPPDVSNNDKHNRVETGNSSRDCTVTTGSAADLAACIKAGTTGK